ncbi:MAG: hypothetical protein QM817_31730 [Archangium sp.]
MVTRARVLVFAGFAVAMINGCQLPSNVLYRCGANGECAADQQCWPDDYCHPLADGEPPKKNDGGTDGGAKDGGVDAGSVDSGTPDAGDVDAGDDAGIDAGADDAGTDAGAVDAGPCIPVGSCPASAQCGAFDAGCGVSIECGECFAPEECGTVTANQCGLPKLCQQGFCWENPLPQGNALFGAFAFGPKTVWAVGESGTVLFWNGERTFMVDVGTTVDLYAVHGTNPSDVFVAGDEGVIVHFNGTTWQRELTPGAFRINALWVAPTGQAFAAANGGSILKRSGTTWTTMGLNPSNTFDVLALAGLDTGEVFAATTTRAYRLPSLNATMWQGETPWNGNPNTRETMAFAAAGPELYVGWKVTNQSFGNIFERQTDAGWRQYGPNIPGGVGAMTLTLGGPWVSTLSGVVTRVLDEGGLVQAPLTRDAGLYAVTPTSIDTVFAAGGLGTMALVTDGGARELFFGGTTNVRGVCGFADTMTYASQAYAASEDQVVFTRVVVGDRARWDSVVRATRSTNWNACFAEMPNRVFVVGSRRDYLRQSAGVFVTDDFGNDSEWYGAWGAPGGPYWFINDSANIFSSASGAMAMYAFAQTPGNPRGVWGLSSSDIMVVGAQFGGVRRYNGSSWNDVVNIPQTFRTLRAIHAQNFADGGSLYSIVGTATAWRRFPDGGFVADTVDAGHLRATYVMPGGDIWAAGDDGGSTGVLANGRGVLWHFDPNSEVWSVVPSPTTRAFYGMGGFGDVGPFAVGMGGVIVRKQGLDGG